MSKRSSVSFERPLEDGDKLAVTIESEGKATFTAPSGWALSVDDLIETRHGGERMYMSRKPAKNRVSDQQIAAILIALILTVVIAIIALLCAG